MKAEFARGMLIAALAIGSSLALAAEPSSPAMPATLADAERAVAEIDAAVGELDGRIQGLDDEAKMKEHRAVARGRAYARLSRVGLLAASGGFDDFVEHAMRVEGARFALTRDLRAATEARRELDAAAQQKKKLLDRRAPLEAQRAALAQAEALVAEARDRQAAFERAFTSSTGPTEHVAIYGAGTGVASDAGTSHAAFASLRGRLPMPVGGRAEVRAAQKNGEPGIEIRTASGAPVRAVASGRVAFSATYGEYGRMVILDHGDHWFSVYGNLDDVEVKVGDEVSGGARLAKVASASGGAFLYFEVRKGSETLDPRVWLGL